MHDYIIIGAGIVGLATAYHLKKMDPDSSILVIDKGHGPGAGDTGRSAAAFRAFFTSRINMALAKTSIEYYRDLQDNGVDLGMMFVGYLFLLDKKLRRQAREGLEEAERMGLDFDTLEPGFIEERLGIRTSVEGLEEAELLGLGDIEEGILVREAGIIAAEKLVEYYYNSIKAMGVDIAFDTEVRTLIIEPRRPLGIEGEPFPWQDARVSGVETSRGEARARRKVIAALGAWSSKVLNPAGIDSYTRPKKRQVFTVKASGSLAKTLNARGLNKYNISPMLVFPKKVFARPEPGEGAYWVGVSDDLGRPFELVEDPPAEEHFYTLGVLPVLSLYHPGFTDKMPSSMWAGNYDISFDGAPIIYEPYQSDLIVSAGTSGSGIMKADAIGRVTASLALGLEEAELYGGVKVKVSRLGLENRHIEPEKLII
ncbi:MAG: FAD-binding oxidoreductase [Desulfurococcales archaeon]|nr:FAD-binding oxidoreductase [Desulfurococcales archaeon]